jgi:hypothetical protein
LPGSELASQLSHLEEVPGPGMSTSRISRARR